MYIVLAFLAAIFASITTIFGKFGMKNASSEIGTAIRSTIIFICTIVLVFVFSSFKLYEQLTLENYMYLSLSGLATYLAWSCYFHAIKIGYISKVVPIDKSSLLFTIILSSVFLGELLTIKVIIAGVLMFIGLVLFVVKIEDEGNKKVKRTWLIYAILAAVFSGIIPILNKEGLQGVDTKIALAYRTLIVVVFAWIYALAKGKISDIKIIPASTWIFLTLSAIATGASWYCYFEALNIGDVVTVSTIDKSSIVFTVFLSFIIFREKLTLKTLLGTLSIVVALLVMIFL